MCVLLCSHPGCHSCPSPAVAPFTISSLHAATGGLCCKPLMISLSCCHNPLFIFLWVLSISLYLQNLLWFFVLFSPVLLLYNLRSVEQDFFSSSSTWRNSPVPRQGLLSFCLGILIPDCMDKPRDASLICSSKLCIKQNMHLISLTCN